MTPDLFVQFENVDDKSAVLKDALLLLCKRLLAEGNLTDEQNGQVARLRAKVQIEF